MQPFHIISLNCKHELFPQKEAAFVRNERILRYIKTINPICAGLQEFTEQMHLSLQPQLDHYTIIGENRYASNHVLNEQTAILVNTQQAIILESKTIWLSATPEKASRLFSSSMPRTCTMVKLRLIATGHECYVFNVHLDVVLPYTRYKQAKILLQFMHEIYQQDPLPMILMGDFNDHYHSKTIRLMQEHTSQHLFQLRDIYTTMNAIQSTFRGLHSFLLDNTPIDYIFVTDDIAIHHAEVVSNFDLPLSDHFPILAELSFH